MRIFLKDSLLGIIDTKNDVNFYGPVQAMIRSRTNLNCVVPNLATRSRPSTTFPTHSQSVFSDVFFSI